MISGRHKAVIASEAKQSSRRALRLLDRRVAIARPEGRASFDALRLLAMTHAIQTDLIWL
jgi:hypothetical protein